MAWAMAGSRIHLGGVFRVHRDHCQQRWQRWSFSMLPLRMSVSLVPAPASTVVTCCTAGAQLFTIQSQSDGAIVNAERVMLCAVP